MNKQQRFYVELPTDVSIDDIPNLNFYPQWDDEVKKFYFDNPDDAKEWLSVILTKKTAITKESDAKPIAINYKYIKFIIEAITYVEWILGIATPLEILTFMAKNPIYTWEHLGKVVAEINVVLIVLVIILFAITIGKVYLKNQYNNKLK